MLVVRAVAEEIEGHVVTAAVDGQGVIWVIVNPSVVHDLYRVVGELLTELVGELPDVWTFEVATAPRPGPRVVEGQPPNHNDVTQGRSASLSVVAATVPDHSSPNVNGRTRERGAACASL